MGAACSGTNVVGQRIDNASRSKQLNLSSCNLKELPKSVQDLENLKVCDVSDNRITNLEPLMFMKKLRKLTATHNRISNLPEDLASLSKLETLEISNNAFDRIEAVCWTLPKLKTLSLASCQIQNIGAPQVCKIAILDLSFNNISSIPDLGNLEHLTDLSLQSNNISEIPDTIRKLKTLQRLNVANNNLSTLPSALYLETKVHLVNIEGNPCEKSLDHTRVDGYQTFADRHKKNFDKGLQGKVMRDSNNLL